MSDEINSPGQLRQYEENQGWLPRQSETPTIGAGDGYNGATLPALEDVKPMTMGRYAQKVSFNKGDYFSHDNKVYYKNPEGKVSLVTGDAMGDVELNDEQTKQLEKDRADQAEKKRLQDEAISKLDYTNDGSLGMDARGDISPAVIGGIQGYTMRPNPGNQYEGLDRNQQFGRFLGTITPGWDTSAEAGDAIRALADKLQNGQPVTGSDAWNLIEKEIKLGADIGTLGTARLFRQ